MMRRNHNRRAIGRWLQERRREAGLSQLEVASRVGVGKQLVTSWETGVNPIPIRWMFLLGEVLGFRMTEFLAVIQKFDPDRADEFYFLAQEFGKFFVNDIRERTGGQIA